MRGGGGAESHLNPAQCILPARKVSTADPEKFTKRAKVLMQNSIQPHIDQQIMRQCGAMNGTRAWCWLKGEFSGGEQPWLKLGSSCGSWRCFSKHYDSSVLATLLIQHMKNLHQTMCSVVRYNKGLPGLLKVTGSYCFARSIKNDLWRCAAAPKDIIHHLK